MIAGMLRLGSKHLQIGRIIVSLVAIDMMDDFSWKQRTSQDLLSNDPMSMPTISLGVGLSCAFIQTGLPEFFLGLRSHPVFIQLRIHVGHSRARKGLRTCSTTKVVFH